MEIIGYKIYYLANINISFCLKLFLNIFSKKKIRAKLALLKRIMFKPIAVYWSNTVRVIAVSSNCHYYSISTCSNPQLFFRVFYFWGCNHKRAKLALLSVLIVEVIISSYFTGSNNCIVVEIIIVFYELFNNSIIYFKIKTFLYYEILYFLYGYRIIFITVVYNCINNSKKLNI